MCNPSADSWLLHLTHLPVLILRTDSKTMHNIKYCEYILFYVRDTELSQNQFYFKQLFDT